MDFESLEMLFYDSNDLTDFFSVLDEIRMEREDME